MRLRPGVRRGGFSLIEVMIAVTILLVIMGAAVQFLRRQTSAVTMDTQRMDALQNAQFAVTQIERELREAGAGVADEQPMIVQLDREAFTFNANMMSKDPADVRSVYRSADADAEAARSMVKSEALALPNSNPGKLYPDTTYTAAKGFPSGAETISYYLTRDSGATTANTFALWRRVNALTPTLVARRIVRSPTDTVPFFTYFKQDTLGRLVTIDPARFPYYHTAIHGSPIDTGKSAVTDSVRVMRLHFVALSVDPRAGKDSLKYRVVESRVRLMNSGLLQLSSCGSKPVSMTAPTLTQQSPTPNSRTVKVTWARATDDGAGEKDIERYAIFRRAAGSTAGAGDPIASVIATRASSYSFTDTNVQPGASYVYGIAAQDCTPRVSDVAEAFPITINP